MLYSNVFKMVNATDSRYLTAEEEEQLLAYANSLPHRVAAARAVEQNESEIVKFVIENMKPKYPNFQKFHDQAWSKAYRDIQLVVRYNVQGMLLDDVEIATDKVLVWLRTILASFNMTPQFMTDTYELTKQGVGKFAPEAYELLAPHFDRTVEILSDFPEPATPAV